MPDGEYGAGHGRGGQVVERRFRQRGRQAGILHADLNCDSALSRRRRSSQNAGAVSEQIAEKIMKRDGEEHENARLFNLRGVMRHDGRHNRGNRQYGDRRKDLNRPADGAAPVSIEDAAEPDRYQNDFRDRDEHFNQIDVDVRV